MTMPNRELSLWNKRILRYGSLGVIVAAFATSGCATLNSRDTFYASGTQERPVMTALKARESILQAYPRALINREGIQLGDASIPFVRFADISSMDIESPLFSFNWVTTIHPYGYTIHYDMGRYGDAKLLVDALYALKYAATKGPTGDDAIAFGEAKGEKNNHAATSVPTVYELESIRRTENEKELADADACKQAKSLNTLPAYDKFLHEHPDSPSRREVLTAISLLIKQQNGSYESYRKFVAEYEDGIEFVPSRYRLTLIGPEGMRVHDIVGLLRQGIKDTVIAAKVRMQNAMYKDFDGKEMVALKKMGMTDVLIETMLDSTGRAKRAREELQKKKEMENLLAEIQQAQKKLDEAKATQEQEQQQPQVAVTGQQDSGPSVGETVKNCAAQIAALEACKHLPWPANSVCAATAKSQFPCQ